MRFTSFLECRFGIGFLILQNTHTHTQQTVLLSAFSFSHCSLGSFHCEQQHGWKAWKFLAVSVRSRERCFGWRLANTMGGGVHKSTLRCHFPHQIPPPPLLPPRSLPDFFFTSTFFPYGRTVQSEKGKSAESRRNQRTAALPPPEHSPEPRLPSPVPPSLPTAPLVSPPLAPRPHMLRSSTE